MRRRIRYYEKEMSSEKNWLTSGANKMEQQKPTNKVKMLLILLSQLAKEKLEDALE